MKIERFEDITVWKDARSLSKQIYSVSKLGEFSKDFGLRDQIRGAAVSVMSNIAEGFERDSNREFVKFLSYSKGSVGEVRSQLYVALDQNYITESECLLLVEDCVKISKQISGFQKYLRKTTK